MKQYNIFARKSNSSEWKWVWSTDNPKYANEVIDFLKRQIGDEPSNIKMEVSEWSTH